MQRPIPHSNLTLLACALALAASLASSACVHHRDRNAPGYVTDLRTPPKDPTALDMRPPRDPGERMMVVTPGLLPQLGGDLTGNTGGSSAPTFQLTAEVSVLWLERDRSHTAKNHKGLMDTLGWLGSANDRTGWGFTLGVDALRTYPDVPDRSANFSGAYAEVQVRPPVFLPMTLGLGYNADVIHQSYGPQLTFFFVPMAHIRLLWYPDEAFYLLAGFPLKIPNIFVWSR